VSPIGEASILSVGFLTAGRVAALSVALSAAKRPAVRPRIVVRSAKKRATDLFFIGKGSGQ
jgi:hypothetical protein